MNDLPCTNDDFNALDYLETPFGDAFVVPVEVFVDTILPPLPTNVQFDALVAEIEQLRGYLRRIVASNVPLGDYSPGTPSQLEAQSAFAPLEACADSVAGAIVDANQTFSFHIHKREDKPLPHDDYPDAYMWSLEDPPASQPPARWHSIAVPGVYEQTASRKTIKRVGPPRCSTATLISY